MSFLTTIGVDIAKLKFDVAYLVAGKYKHKTFTNDAPGHAAFATWLVALCGDVKPLICMEATGAYSLPLADFLAHQGHAVSVVNPANIRELQALVRRVEHLLEMIRMERNRQDTANAKVAGSIDTVLITLEAELQANRKAIHDHINNHPGLKQRGDLLATIPGIGDASTAHLLIALSQHHAFVNAKQVVAFAGLAPALRQSGQWSGNTHIAKNGDALLRKALYMPALCALRFNPPIRTFCQRLKANGKNGKAIACAAMRKLIHIAFGVLKSGKPFDPNYAA